MATPILVTGAAAMADLHRDGRHDRMSDEVLTLTGFRQEECGDIHRVG